eukprot:TRINITY_DN13774_c0_g2_i1.p1 TRINITY_DN13774_c0_g2~~TRINITY_DN13774_c0_g2_i1.p1  ORF type:complete len:254 (-),score=41.44 TRINITY_DN13774_c0_g2_i1:54-815(-)
MVQLLQSDSATVGYILPAFDHILKAVDKCIADLPTEEASKMRSVRGNIQARHDKYLNHEGGWIAAATLLTPALTTSRPAPPKDPRAIVKYTASKDVKTMAKRYLRSIDAELPPALLEFLGHSGVFAPDEMEDYSSLVWRKSPEEWWRLLLLEIPTNLGRVAHAFVGIPASSAALERTFSTMGWVGHGRRNRLIADKASKLAVVHASLKCKTPDAMWWDAEQLAAIDVDDDDGAEQVNNDTPSDCGDESDNSWD